MSKAAGPQIVDDVGSVVRLAEHLLHESGLGRCDLVDTSQDWKKPYNRCADRAVGVRWEDGFADDVCERHAEAARKCGALVVYPSRANGTVAPGGTQ